MDLYIELHRRVWQSVFVEQQVQREVRYPVELGGLMEGPFSDLTGRQVLMDPRAAL